MPLICKKKKKKKIIKAIHLRCLYKKKWQNILITVPLNLALDSLIEFFFQQCQIHFQSIF